MNEQELADIQALLKDLGGMLKSFLVADGAGNGLSGATGDLSRFSTISSFEADFEYRASVRYLNVEPTGLAHRHRVGRRLQTHRCRRKQPCR